MEIAIAPVNQAQERPVANTAFWPTIDLAQYRAAMRQDGTLTPVRVREAALNAMHEVNARLASGAGKRRHSVTGRGTRRAA